MGKPVVHFEIIGTDPQRLRAYYGELFGWEFDTSGGVSASVSEAGNYGFVQNPDGAGIRTMGPERAPNSPLVVGHFTDPEGHLIGVAGTA